MHKVIASAFMTLDGVVQDPGGFGETEHGGDSVVMAKAWDDHTRGGVRAADSMHETAPTIKHPRRFGQLPNLAVPDTVDDPLPDTEIDAWEGSPPGEMPCPAE